MFIYWAFILKIQKKKKKKKNLDFWKKNFILLYPIFFLILFKKNKMNYINKLYKIWKKK